MSYYTPPSSGSSGNTAIPPSSGSSGSSVMQTPPASSVMVVPSTRVKNSAVVARQLPEHIREDYPTFVAFVEAYYEFLQAQGVDFSTIRDIDRTLDSFVVNFKKELAYNLPNIAQDERFLIQRIKDQYLSKGSEGSYKLLFRLLFGKEVQVGYPGRQMLRASDGKWNQEISIFAKVEFGDPNDVIGKLVDIQTSGRILRVLVDKKQDLVGEVDRITLIDPTQQIYEFFLDKKFFGNINPGDKLRYLNDFQATILPATKNILIVQEGKNFRPGQVFELRSGSGTGAILKINNITPSGGIKYAELIKFGIGYTANFAINLLASNPINVRTQSVFGTTTQIENNTFQSSASGSIQAAPNSATVVGSATFFGAAGNVQVGDQIWTPDDPQLLIGVVKSIESETSLTLDDLPENYSGSINTSYNDTYVFRNNRSVGDLLTYGPESVVQALTYNVDFSDATLGFDEQGYINSSDYVDYEYVDGTYAGSLLREFSLNFRNAQTESDEPAIVNVSLGAIVKYPGYFENNSGFLNDSIYIQDSRYYQTFSYVLKIDERLESYKSAVKTMVHPAGMALFGEFDINNKFDLSLTLESLVRSLGIGLSDEVEGETDEVFLSTSKVLSSTINTPNDSLLNKSLSKILATVLAQQNDVAVLSTTKSVTSVLDAQTDAETKAFTKSLTTSYSGSVDSITNVDVSKALQDTPIVTEIFTHQTAKYVDDDEIDSQEHQGYVQVNSYYGQDYIIFEDEYSVGSRESTFTTP